MNPLLAELFPGQFEIFSSYEKVSQSPDLTTRIMQLRQARDKQKYINVSYLRTDQGQVFMLRDACLQARIYDPVGKGPDPTQVYEQVVEQGHRNSSCYLMMALNYTLSVQVLLAVNNIAFDNEALLSVCDRMLQHSEQEQDKSSRVAIILGLEAYFYEYLQRVLLPVVCEAGLAPDQVSALALLDTIKDWMAMDHAPLSMLTLDQLTHGRTRQPVYLARVDEPVYALTAEQKAELTHFQGKAWFLRLSPQEQKIYQHYFLDKLLAGRVIPSQLRSRLPLLKNAYRHRMYLAEKKGETYQVTQLLAVNHCGGMPYFDKRERPDEVQMQQVCDQNIKQQVQFARELSKQEQGRRWQNHVITLCSEQGDALRGAYEDWCNLFKAKNGRLPNLLRLMLLSSYFTLIVLPILLVKKSLQVVLFLLPYGQSIQTSLFYLVSPLTSFVTQIKLMLRPWRERWFGSYKPYLGFDSHIVKKTRASACAEPHCYSANICLNEFSAFESHDFRGVVEIYQQAVFLLKFLQEKEDLVFASVLQEKMKKLKQKMGSVAFALASNKFKQDRGFFDKVNHYFLRLVDPCVRFISSFFNAEVNAIQVMAVLAQLVQQINLAYNEYKDREIPHIHLWFGCASGENRTGLTEYHLQCEAVQAAQPTMMKNRLRSQLAMSNHVQEITAFQGGNAGMQGIRSKSMKSLPADYTQQHCALLVTPYSDMKSVQVMLAKLAKKKKKLAKAKQGNSGSMEVTEEDFKRWFGLSPVAAILKQPLEQEACECKSMPLPQDDPQVKQMLARLTCLGAVTQAELREIGIVSAPLSARAPSLAENPYALLVPKGNKSLDASLESLMGGKTF